MMKQKFFDIAFGVPRVNVKAQCQHNPNGLLNLINKF